MSARVNLTVGLLAAAALTACSSGTRGSHPGVPESTGTAAPSPATSSPATASSSPATASAATPAPATSGSATAAGPGPLTDVTLAVPGAFATGAFTTKRILKAPAGSSVSVFARIPGARFIVETPQHDLLVSVPSTGDLVLLVNGRQTTIATGVDSPQGMAFDTVGGQQVLYVAGTTTLDRFVWTGTGLGAKTSILTGLPGGDSYAHFEKEVVVAADHDVFLDIGSASNATPADRSHGEAEIIKVAAGQTKASVVMTGVRNGDGLSFDPTGQLWTAVNMRDLIAEPGTGQVVQSYVNDHPPDEIVKVTQGRDLGWPFCDPDQTLAKQSDPYADVPLRNDAQTDANGAVDCAKLPPVERGIHAHSAPLGFHFLQGTTLPTNYRQGAVLATHGSNNAVPARPAELDWLPWTGSTLGASQPWLAGFVDSSGDRWGKPVDAVAGADGSLYVTDDTAGAVYRLTLASANSLA